MRPFLILSLFCSLSIHHLYCSYDDEYNYWSTNQVEPTPVKELTPYVEHRYLNRDFDGEVEYTQKKIDDVIVSTFNCCYS